MYNEEREIRDDDLVITKPLRMVEKPGSLIPLGTAYTAGEFRVEDSSGKRKKRLPVAAVVVALFTIIYSSVSVAPLFFNIQNTASAVAAPTVYINDLGTSTPQALKYGSDPLLSQPNFFSQTKEAFMSEGVAFIEADLSAMKIIFHEGSEVKFEADILSKGKEGSWWETPAGLYKVELKKENHFSSFGQVYQPWSMVFQGNFFIHGWPTYPGGQPVAEGYSGGCIRLSTEDAGKLYKLVETGTPVLVYEEDFFADGFMYEPKAPEVTADNYLVIDIDNNTILAGDNIHEVVPIASLTKLMTALVAAEYINLDNTVRISQEKYVTTLIPRLQGRYRVSMYSLMQLLLVESSNEAAEVIASVIGRDNFIAKMNKKAKSLGLQDTVFTDPSGLDNGNVSSATDLARLLQYIHNNRSFILDLTEDADLETAYVKGEFGELNNFNGMNGVANFVGGKVGETQAAGMTSATLHTLKVDGEERTIGIILLGSQARTDDVKALHKYVDERYGN